MFRGMRKGAASITPKLHHMATGKRPSHSPRNRPLQLKNRSGKSSFLPATAGKCRLLKVLETLIL